MGGGEEEQEEEAAAAEEEEGEGLLTVNKEGAHNALTGNTTQGPRAQQGPSAKLRRSHTLAFFARAATLASAGLCTYRPCIVQDI